MNIKLKSEPFQKMYDELVAIARDTKGITNDVLCVYVRQNIAHCDFQVVWANKMQSDKIYKLPTKYYKLLFRALQEDQNAVMIQIVKKEKLEVYLV